MKLHDLKPDAGSKRKRKRVGRGISAGQGKTAGRGHKGQGARSGGGKGPYFEGGQLPMVRRLPFKRGFTNIFAIEYQEVNVDMLEARFIEGAVVNGASLVEAGLVRKAEDPIKVLGRGELSKKLEVHANKFTKSAAGKIEGVGGSVNQHALKVTGARATVKRMRKVDMVRLFGDGD
ncbi:MAG: 50S ribosomal protein L15 [Anaerolineae bacterium]|nr:50S ribosomal protein L15 [Anaerolineae bacterium]